MTNLQIIGVFSIQMVAAVAHVNICQYLNVKNPWLFTLTSLAFTIGMGLLAARLI